MLHHDSEYEGSRSVLKLFYKNDVCALTAIRRFRTLKSIKLGPITTNGLRKMIAKFEETSSFDVKRGRKGNSFGCGSGRLQDYSFTRKDEQ